MSYYVEYNPELKNRYPNTNKKRQKIPVKPVLISLVLAVAVYIAFGGGLLKFIIPGEDNVTVDAFSQMVERVEAGIPVKEAILTFCEDVIAGGNE